MSLVDLVLIILPTQKLHFGPEILFDKDFVDPVISLISNQQSKKKKISENFSHSSTGDSITVFQKKRGGVYNGVS